jgi:signal transduction histidine kinase
MVNIPLAPVLASSLVMVHEKCLKQGIALSVDIKESSRDIEISADERKLKQIMFNLLSNAVKFTPDGGSITVRAGVENEQSGIANQEPEILISVADTGIGIKPEDHEQIFRPFEQVDPSFTRKKQGTGLGLALVRQFVALHGGRVWVESEVGKGSTFWFTMPIA